MASYVPSTLYPIPYYYYAPLHWPTIPRSLVSPANLASVVYVRSREVSRYPALYLIPDVVSRGDDYRQYHHNNTGIVVVQSVDQIVVGEHAGRGQLFSSQETEYLGHGAGGRDEAKDSDSERCKYKYLGQVAYALEIKSQLVFNTVSSANSDIVIILLLRLAYYVVCYTFCILASYQYFRILCYYDIYLISLIFTFI